MSREIKFRAWDGEKMRTDCNIDAAYGFVSRQEPVGDYCDAVTKDWSLMQFTGLLDAQGREIYEGDVVIWHGLDANENGRVVWSQKDSRFAIQFKDGEPYGFGITEGQNRIQIIGNIYEHPHLLSDNKEGV